MTIKHSSRVVQDALERRAVRLDNRFRVISSLHGSADDNVVVTAEHIHDPPIPAASAEKVELLGVGLFQEHGMTALCDDVVVVHQCFGAVTGAIDNDVFSQLREIIFAFELSSAKSRVASSQVDDKFR